MEPMKTLKELVKEKAISQLTMDRVIVAKQYIERKYNLKTEFNSEWNSIIDKINKLNIPDAKKEQAKKEIYEKEVAKFRRQREKISIRDYESLCIIGRGGFGEVHVCKEKKTGNVVAIKKIRKDVLIAKDQILHTRNEQLFMSKVKSKWIVELKASFQEDNYLFLVMEFLPGGDLMSLLIKKDILTEKEARFYIAEMILAIEEIHKLDCIHRDIKPDNVLIDKKGHLKLSDFGLAKVSDKLYELNSPISNKKSNSSSKHKRSYSCVGTAYYVAPEVLAKVGYNKSVDWWSVGNIFFEMLFGYAPFCSKDTKEVCQKISEWNKYLVFPKKEEVSKEAIDLIKKLITGPENRLGRRGANEIKAHPFFKGLDWENIRETTAPFVPTLKNDWDTEYFEIFEPRESFYPPIRKNKKRKDVEYLGYTYKGDDEELNAKDLSSAMEIAESLKDIPAEASVNIPVEESPDSLTETFNKTSNDTNIEHKNSLSKTNKSVINSNSTKINSDNTISDKVNNLVNATSKNPSNNKLQIINLPLKKIKIDCSKKSPRYVNTEGTSQNNLKNQGTHKINWQFGLKKNNGRPLRLSPNPQRPNILDILNTQINKSSSKGVSSKKLNKSVSTKMVKDKKVVKKSGYSKIKLNFLPNQI